jgi:hypothetical protein
MKIEIFIATSGGCITAVRGDIPNMRPGTVTWKCYVVDYDELECENDQYPKEDQKTEEQFEREKLDGRTWAEIEKTSEAVF